MMPSRLLITPGKAPDHQTRVRLVIQHPMETGFRFDLHGRAITKNVIHTLRAQYDGVLAFEATLGSGISADPYLEFFVHTPKPGELVINWVDDAGETGSAAKTIGA